ncbi:MAG: dTDP-4-dehydrorhamnose 3,5-epimerase family protein [Bacteroidales bacterium]|nr:dTDP-4-dehydrorhamnose 3,5-epimerase family protein [Bacteroidales bacterium]
MYIENTPIPGLKLIHLKEFKDNRGSFIKVFNEDFFAENGLKTNFKESYYSISHKNVIRGMHFQIPPAEHTKLVYVNQGSIIDVVLDIRKSSPTFGQHFFIELNTENPILIYIPVGIAHGFFSLDDHTMVTYLQTSCYNNACDKGIKYNSFGMDWGIVNPIMNERDLSFPDFADTNFNFE